MTLGRKSTMALMLGVATMLRVASAQEAARPAEHGVIDFLAPILPDPVLQHSKETYVLYGCAYCHGVDLRVRNGEAADLLHSRLVGADENGNIIGGLLKAGIPQTAKLSPMPQYSDLSDREMADIARWIHYSRMQGRYTELMRIHDDPAGDRIAGKTYYEKSCSTCHASSEMAKMVKSVKESDLKAFVIRPAFLESVPSFDVSKRSDKEVAGRTRHSRLLENYTGTDVANLLAFLKTMK